MLNLLFPIGNTWDWGTFILYVSVSLIVCALCKSASKYKVDKNVKIKNGGLAINKGTILYFLAFAILTSLATFRSSEVGCDTAIYVGYFQNYDTINFSWEDLLRFHQMEPGFQLYLFLLRKITDNYHVFFFVTFAFVAAMYIKYIKYFFDRDSNYTFLQIFIFFYASNMSGMRSAVATGFVLSSFIFLSQKKYLNATVLTVIASAFHYTMFFNVLMILTTYIMERRTFWRKKWILPFGLIITSIISFGMAGLLKSILALTKYDYYSSIALQDLSILGSLIYLIYAVLAFCFHKEISARFATNKKLQNIFLITMGFLLTYPAMYVIAAYRIPNYYSMPRLTIWSEFACITEQKFFEKNRLVFRIMLQSIIILYLLFRFTRFAADGHFVYLVEF